MAEAEARYIHLPAEEAMAAVEENFKKRKKKLTCRMSLLETSCLLYLCVKVVS